jgi:hypothetical protein
VPFQPGRSLTFLAGCGGHYSRVVATWSSWFTMTRVDGPPSRIPHRCPSGREAQRPLMSAGVRTTRVRASSTDADGALELQRQGWLALR